MAVNEIAVANGKWQNLSFAFDFILDIQVILCKLLAGRLRIGSVFGRTSLARRIACYVPIALASSRLGGSDPAMPFDPVYHEETLSREELNQIPGPLLVEFGANWCGICRSFSPVLEKLLSEYPAVRHIRVEDGRGKPLGRSFRVKLWPTLVLMRDGRVVRQIARPGRHEAGEGLVAITAAEQSQS